MKSSLRLDFFCCKPVNYDANQAMADFKYGVNTDVNIGVSVTKGGNTLFEVMCICLVVTHIYPIICVLTQNVTENVSVNQ